MVYEDIRRRGQTNCTYRSSRELPVPDVIRHRSLTNRHDMFVNPAQNALIQFSI